MDNVFIGGEVSEMKKRIEKLRSEKKIPISELVNGTSMSRTTYWRVMNRGASISLEDLKVLVNRLGYDVFVVPSGLFSGGSVVREPSSWKGKIKK